MVTGLYYTIKRYAERNDQKRLVQAYELVIADCEDYLESSKQLLDREQQVLGHVSSCQYDICKRLESSTKQLKANMNVIVKTNLKVYDSVTVKMLEAYKHKVLAGIYKRLAR